MKIRERTASDEITQKFTGKEHDDGTNLDYFGARYYDADMGIWISPDAQRQFHGPYTYAGNGTSPTNGVDKDGNLLVIGAVVGGVGGAACGMLSVWYSDNLNIWQAGMIVASSAAGGVVMGTLDPSMGIGTVMAIGAATGVTTQYLENVAKGKANPLKWDGGDYGEIAASGVLGAVVPGAGKVVGKAIEPTIPVLKAGMKATSAKGMKVVAEIAKAKSMAKAGDQAMDFVETGVDILLTSKKEGAFSN
jgi:RHS repeat-associated protein